MRWPGFRKVRGQVKKRVGKRLAELDLDGLADYRDYLAAHPEEWANLDAMTHITISRFYRDRGVWDFLRESVLVELAERAGDTLRAWSAGCASGEEPYTLQLCWDFDVGSRLDGVDLRIVATDADAHMLERARRACYPEGNLRELPDEWVERAFTAKDGELCLREDFRDRVHLERQDIRRQQPSGPFDLWMCRNLLFTYFDEDVQRELLAEIRDKLRDGAALVVGAHEEPPEGCGFEAWSETHGVHRKR